MLKFLLISIIVIYVLAKVSKYMMRWAFMLAGKKLQEEMEKQAHYQQNPAYEPPQTVYQEAEEVKVYVPREDKANARPKNFPGGEYVDFEEVK